MLTTLDIKGATITIDAIGTTNLVAKKYWKKGHYVLSLKKNQGNMYEGVADHFASEHVMDKSDFNEENIIKYLTDF